MTNLEKFKEVFGFEIDPIYEEQDYDNDYEEQTFCNQLTCDNCPFQYTKACVYHEPKTFWSAEYEAPKKDNEWIDSIRKNGEYISRHMKGVKE